MMLEQVLREMARVNDDAAWAWTSSYDRLLADAEWELQHDPGEVL